MNGSSSPEGADLRALLAMLRRRAPVIGFAVIVGIVAALIFSHSQAKSYESTAKLLFRPTLLDYAVTGVTLQVPNNDQQREADTNLALISLSDVRQRAAARLGPGYTPTRIKNDVSVSSSGKTDIVSIKASAPTPQQASRVANAVAIAFVTKQRADQRDQVLRAVKKVRHDLRQGGLSAPVHKALQANLERLNLLAAVQTGNVQIVQSAEPASSPSSPKTTLNVILGGGFGLLLGLGLALGGEQLDRRVRRADQLGRALGLPILATIPRSRALRRRANFGNRDAGAAEEPFRRLRASLRHVGGETERRSTLVTSAREGSGKTTVATHLAAALAAGGLARVLLIEADLRRPQLAARLNLPAARGLSTLLESADPFGPDASDHIFHVPLGGGSNGSGPAGAGGVGFDALPGGPVPDDPSELLESGAMRELLAAARSRYDVIVIEAPPPTLVADAIPLLKQADGVLVVGRLGREREPELRQLREELERFSVKPVGAVANFSGRPKAYYAKGR